MYILRNALGPMEVLCKITALVQPICYNLKVLDLMCALVDFVSDSIVDVVIKGLYGHIIMFTWLIQLMLQDLDEFIDRIHKMFYVSVSFTKHSFNFNTNSSKPLSQIKSEIVADIKKKAKIIYIFSYWMDIVSAMMFLWTFLK